MLDVRTHILNATPVAGLPQISMVVHLAPGRLESCGLWAGRARIWVLYGSTLALFPEASPPAMVPKCTAIEIAKIRPHVLDCPRKSVEIASIRAPGQISMAVHLVCRARIAGSLWQYTWAP